MSKNFLTFQFLLDVTAYLLHTFDSSYKVYIPPLRSCFNELCMHLVSTLCTSTGFGFKSTVRTYFIVTQFVFSI